MTSQVSPAASYLTPKRAKLGVRHHLQLFFPSQAIKDAFLARLDCAKQRLFPEGDTIDNYRLFTVLLDALNGRVAGNLARRAEPGISLATLEPLLVLRLGSMKIILLVLPLDYNFVLWLLDTK